MIELGKLSPSNPPDARRSLGCAGLQAGFPISKSTLEQRAFRRDGPPYYLFNGRALYIWEEVLAWATAKARRCNPGERSPLSRSPAQPTPA